MAASAGDETALKGWGCLKWLIQREVCCSKRLLYSHRAYQQGVDMNLGDYDGRTALHLAAAEGHARCVKFLLDTCGVKHDPKDRQAYNRFSLDLNIFAIKLYFSKVWISQSFLKEDPHFSGGVRLLSQKQFSSSTRKWQQWSNELPRPESSRTR